MSDKRISEALWHIREAAEILEESTAPRRSLLEARYRLAWHHLIDAYNLILTGRLTPEDMTWAENAAKTLAAPDTGDLAGSEAP